MSKKLWWMLSVLIGLPVLFVGLLIVHWFIYPLTSANPSFSDVEATFNKLQIPSDWKVIEESENKGLRGRQCPIESDGCFNKQRVYSVESSVTKEDVKNVVLSSGCVSVASKDNSQVGSDKESYTYSCFDGGVELFGTWEKDDEATRVRVTSASE